MDPEKPDDLISDIFDPAPDGLALLKDDFFDDIRAICEFLAQSYKQFLQFDNHPVDDSQFMHVTAHIYTLIETLYSSTKLLTYGFLGPSGNLFRVSLEAMSMSILLGWRGEILVEKKTNKWQSSNFYKDFLADAKWTKPHLAIKTLEMNRSKVGMTEYGLIILKESKSLYNDYSHASPFSIRLSVISEQRSSFGGGYHREQKFLIESELKIRRQFCQLIPAFLESLHKRLA